MPDILRASPRTDDAPLFAATCKQSLQVADEHAEAVYAEFEKIALDLIRRGRKHYSSDGILHVVRFNRAIAGTDADGFKVNNNLSAPFARRFIAEHPEHELFFELRRSKLDTEIKTTEGEE